MFPGGTLGWESDLDCHGVSPGGLNLMQRRPADSRSEMAPLGETAESVSLNCASHMLTVTHSSVRIRMSQESTEF